MNRMFFVNLIIFLAMQVAAHTALKLGTAGGTAMGSRRWWYGFIAANAVGMPSILFLKELYGALPLTPNIVPVLVMAGTFILTQLVFILFFRSRPSITQWIGVAMLAAGAIMASLGT